MGLRENLTYKGCNEIGMKENLSPHCVGPYQILRRVGKVAYKLELPNEFAPVHLIFHVSMAKHMLEIQYLLEGLIVKRESFL